MTAEPRRYPAPLTAATILAALDEILAEFGHEPGDNCCDPEMLSDE